MDNFAQDRLILALAFRDGDIRAAADARRLWRPDRHPIRRRIGNSIIRLGERLAAEPPRRPARSR